MGDHVRRSNQPGHQHDLLIGEGPVVRAAGGGPPWHRTRTGAPGLVTA